MRYKEAYPVLRKMMDDFDSWFPFDGTEDEEEKEMYREGFARCKLNLELGEYTGEELDYLYQIYDTVKKRVGCVVGILEDLILVAFEGEVKPDIIPMNSEFFEHGFSVLA